LLNLHHFEPKGTSFCLPIQAALPYDEPPAWYLPVANRLGEALAQAGDFSIIQTLKLGKTEVFSRTLG
jgi:hypothetical protein